MFKKSDFEGLKLIIEDKQKINMEFSDFIEAPKYSIYPANGLTIPSMDFIVDESKFIILNLFLEKIKQGTGIAIFEWIKDFCKRNKIRCFEVRTVADDKIDMHKLCKNMGMESFKNMAGSDAHYKLEII